MAYSEKQIKDTFDLILQRIEEGESVRDILLDETMPSSRTFFKWLREDSDKVKQYEISMGYRDDKLFEEILEIAYKTEEGTTTKTTERGIETTTGDMLGHRRLKIDALKWYLSKRNPKKYGDKSKDDDDKEDEVTEINVNRIENKS